MRGYPSGLTHDHLHKAYKAPITHMPTGKLAVGFEDMAGAVCESGGLGLKGQGLGPCGLVPSWVRTLFSASHAKAFTEKKEIPAPALIFKNRLINIAIVNRHTSSSDMHRGQCGFHAVICAFMMAGFRG